MIMKTFGENLKNERQLAGFTQRDLAKAINVKQQQVSQWECNKVEPTLYNIVAIIKALNISFEDLIDDIE